MSLMIKNCYSILFDINTPQRDYYNTIYNLYSWLESMTNAGFYYGGGEWYLGIVTGP